MTDQGLTFYATVTAANGAILNRETDDRAELLAWLQAHAGEGIGTIDRLGMEASGPAILHMLQSLYFGLARMGDPGVR